MTDLEYLQARVPGFAGYADEESRHESDRRVRAIVGAALADAQARLVDRLAGDVSTSLEALIFRCEFPDQRYVTELDHRHLEEQQLATLARIDRALVEQVGERLVGRTRRNSGPGERDRPAARPPGRPRPGVGAAPRRWAPARRRPARRAGR